MIPRNRLKGGHCDREVRSCFLCPIESGSFINQSNIHSVSLSEIYPFALSFWYPPVYHLVGGTQSIHNLFVLRCHFCDSSLAGPQMWALLC